MVSIIGIKLLVVDGGGGGGLEDREVRFLRKSNSRKTESLKD